MYLTYDEYQAYGGELDEADFVQAEFRARKRLDELTDGRVARMAVTPEAVKLAMLSIIGVDGAVGVEAQAKSPMAASFSTDGYSESYGSAESRTAAIEKQLTGSIETLLDGVTDDDGVPLLYAGVPTLGAPWIGGIIP